MTRRVGILTAGGDSPGLNAAIRGFGKAALGHGMELIGFRDGLKGLVEDRWQKLDGQALAGILTIGGTILGTSRDKPHKMLVDGEIRDMTPTIIENYERNKLDAIVCIGGGGTAKNANRLSKAGLNVIHLPKTIDNDIAHTDTSFGFSTALGIATDAVDRLHSTAHSHHRVIVVEIMGHKAGWLALGAGIAGGADIILIPEIPYSIESVAESVRGRAASGRPFSVIAIAEGARDLQGSADLAAAVALKSSATSPEARAAADKHKASVEAAHRDNAFRVASALESATGLESRVTILGYVQRGGTPDANDRLLGTLLGSAGADLVAAGEYGVTVASQGGDAVPVPLAEVAGNLKTVPLDHPWLTAARGVGTGLGD
ncbi:6-phosphofructokinase [Tessaracoccus palaemonis]|uniref:ATP-dependent 6-phosphofructokinase n=1 Tax=Tessaracoccus palaemonis TaxID=2829499 RepID=A0ABX8SI42_9ACTN|nr:ATP-dependent 6-phosphofructokinase [Tessaracoccus palaemonis]QXT62554.1 ATP-dependent 6-phosphofructokinase [Tessaracoccus palaemonis]